MSKKTLLQMVQNILSAMNSDEVNSISDTVESLQVAEVVRETYEDLVATLGIPERRNLVQLESLADTDRPNYLKLPDNVRDVQWVRYNNKLVSYLPPSEFMDHVLQTVAPNTTVQDPSSNIQYTVAKNADPQYYTSFDDKHLAFDSYNSTNDSVLQTSKSMVLADMNNSFQLVDDFICDLDDNLFPTLLAEAKNACFINFKQASNANEAARARRGLVRAQNELNRTPTGNPSDRLPNYGRRR